MGQQNVKAYGHTFERRSVAELFENDVVFFKGDSVGDPDGDEPLLERPVRVHALGEPQDPHSFYRYVGDVEDRRSRESGVTVLLVAPGGGHGVVARFNDDQHQVLVAR